MISINLIDFIVRQPIGIVVPVRKSQSDARPPQSVFGVGLPGWQRMKQPRTKET
jgi:hypothetical protein